MTPREYIAKLRDNLMRAARSKGDHCPVCEQFVKVYRRSIYYSMIRDWVELMHVAESRTFSSGGRKVRRAAGGDVLKLRFWKLIEQCEESGSWRTTDEGMLFLRGGSRVPKIALVYNQRFLGFEDEKTTVSVYDCCGEKFSINSILEVVRAFKCGT